jgi:hypothetical protein
MWVRVRPFQHLNGFATLLMVTQGHRPERPGPADSYGDTLPDDVWACIQMCWAQAVPTRPHMREAVHSLEKAVAQADHALVGE